MAADRKTLKLAGQLQRDATSYRYLGAVTYGYMDTHLQNKKPVSHHLNSVQLGEPCSSTPLACHQSLQPLLPRRAISCGQGVMGSHELPDQTHNHSDNTLELEIFESAEQALETAEVVGFPVQMPLKAADRRSSSPGSSQNNPPSVDGAIRAGRHRSELHQQAVAAALQTALLGPSSFAPPAYASESGTALLQPDLLTQRGGSAGAGADAGRDSLQHAPVHSAPPAGPLLLPAATLQERALPAATAMWGAAAALAGQLPFQAPTDIEMAEMQQLLQPCGNPSLPMEAGWLLARRACGAGPGKEASPHSSLTLTVDSDEDERPSFADMGLLGGGGAVHATFDDRNVTTAKGLTTLCAAERHRACEFGYTTSAPVHGGGLAARRDLACLFLQGASGLAELQALAGALSAPAMAPAVMHSYGSYVNAAGEESAVCTAAPRKGAAGGAGLAPNSTGSCCQAAGLGGARTSVSETRRCEPEPRDGNSVGLRPMKGAAVSGSRLSSSRRAASTTRRTRNAILASAAAAEAARHLPHQSTTSASQPGLWAASSFAASDRQSLGSNYFGTALAVGLSTLLDNLAVEVSTAGPTARVRSHSPRLSPPRESDSAWIRARGQAKILRDKLMSCFTGGASSSAPASASVAGRQLPRYD